MKFRIVLLTLLMFVASFANGCAKRCENMATDILSDAFPDEFRVFKNTDGMEQNAITQSSDNAEIVALIDIIRNADGKWRIDPTGVPVGFYRVVFYRGGDRIVSFSFGNQTIISQGCSYFAAANISKDDQQLLSEITKVDPEKQP